MLRRIVAIAAFLGLLALEPGTVSLCATLAGMPGECAALATRSACDQMGAAQTDAQVGAQARGECCQLTSAPIPEAQGKASAPSSDLSKDFVVLPSLEATQGVPRESNFWGIDSSPPDLLPFLCTLLI